MSKKVRSPEEQAQIDYLIALPDGQIDLVDIPEASEESWAQARRFYGSNETPVTLRLDTDVLACSMSTPRGTAATPRLTASCASI